MADERGSRARLAREIEQWLLDQGAVVTRGAQSVGIPVLLIQLPNRSRHRLHLIDVQGDEHHRLDEATEETQEG